MRNYSIAGKRGQWPAAEDTSFLSYLTVSYLGNVHENSVLTYLTFQPCGWFLHFERVVLISDFRILNFALNYFIINAQIAKTDVVCCKIKYILPTGNC